MLQIRDSVAVSPDLLETHVRRPAQNWNTVPVVPRSALVPLTVLPNAIQFPEPVNVFVVSLEKNVKRPVTKANLVWTVPSPVIVRMANVIQRTEPVTATKDSMVPVVQSRVLPALLALRVLLVIARTEPVAILWKGSAIVSQASPVQNVNQPVPKEHTVLPALSSANVRMASATE